MTAVIFGVLDVTLLYDFQTRADFLLSKGPDQVKAL